MKSAGLDKQWALSVIEAFRIKYRCRPVCLALDILRETVMKCDGEQVDSSSKTYLRYKTSELLKTIKEVERNGASEQVKYALGPGRKDQKGDPKGG
jgi:hypothetical protein